MCDAHCIIYTCIVLHIAKKSSNGPSLNDFVRDKLAYSENQASKNLKLYRVKQKEVGISLSQIETQKFEKTLP